MDVLNQSKTQDSMQIVEIPTSWKGRLKLILLASLGILNFS